MCGITEVNDHVWFVSSNLSTVIFMVPFALPEEPAVDWFSREQIAKECVCIYRRFQHRFLRGIMLLWLLMVLASIKRVSTCRMSVYWNYRLIHLNWIRWSRCGNGWNNIIYQTDVLKIIPRSLILVAWLGISLPNEPNSSNRLELENGQLASISMDWYYFL